MKMVVETCCYSPVHGHSDLDPYLGMEVHTVNTFFDYKFPDKEAGTGRLSLTDDYQSCCTIHGTVLFVDDEGYPL
jgi:hypothetical protein